MQTERHFRMRRAGRLLPLLLVFGFASFLAAGCDLVSGTIRIEQDFEEGEKTSTGTNVAALGVDLNENADFRDHKDQINSVDEVGFVFRARNNGDPAHGEIWLSSTPIIPPTATNIRAQAKKVVSGVVLEPAYTDITYDESLALEVPENLTYLHETVKGGTFYLYGIADTSEFNITIDKLTAVVVATVEL